MRVVRGLGAVPVRHGLTIGEVAQLVKLGMPWGAPRFAQSLDCDLTVVPMRGWRRAMSFAETGLPWVMPSPNMPTPDTALCYPGQCLFEATNLSEGRGITRPFEIVGAPFLDGYAWAEALAAEKLPGVRFRPLSFKPMFHKFAGKSCGGVQLPRDGCGGLSSLPDGDRALGGGAAAGPRWVSLAGGAVEFVANPPAINLLTGSDEVRRGSKPVPRPRRWRPAS